MFIYYIISTYRLRSGVISSSAIDLGILMSSSPSLRISFTAILDLLPDVGDDLCGVRGPLKVPLKDGIGLNAVTLQRFRQIKAKIRRISAQRF